MVKPPDAEASAIGCAVSDHSNGLVGASPNDLLVLRALGKRRRMAKTIRQTSAGQSLIEPHDGRTVFQVAHARTLNASNIMQVGRGLATIADDEFIVRGAVFASANRNRMRRLLHAKDSSPATMVEVPRAYVFFDVDGADPLIDFDPRNQVIEDEAAPDDPASFVPWESAIDEFIHEALPRPFHGISCWWQFTASMGFKPGLHMRLLFVLDRPMMKDELTRWIGPHLRQHKLDPAVFGAVQQILVAPPILQNGANDPIRYRRGWLTGYRHVVTPPTAVEISKMAEPRRPVIRRSAERVIDLEINGKRALNFNERLARIGDGPDQDGFHNALLAAIGSWIRRNENDADTAALQAALTTAIAAAPRDDARHPIAYLAAQIEALPHMIADVQRMEEASRAARARRSQQAVARPCAAPTGSLQTAEQDTHEAIATFLVQVPTLLKVRDSFWREAQTRFGTGYPIQGLWQQRAAVLVGTGIGKSQTAIAEIGAQMVGPSGYRIAYVVPEHQLAGDVCRRFNAMAGHDIAQVWRGISQPDPVDGAVTMCRRPTEANLVQLAGGDIGSLCGSSKRGSLCPHHPEAGGACAYLRQRQATPQIWIVPAAMLTKAVPGPMQREAVISEIGGQPYAARPPAFDLLVLDESPFLGFLGGFDDEGFHVPLDWLDPDQWEGSLDEDEPAGAAPGGVGEVLRIAEHVIRCLHQGKSVADALQAHDKVDFAAFETAVQRLWRGVEKAARVISPAVDASALAEALAPYMARARRLRGVQRFLTLLADVGTGKAHPAAIERSYPDGRWGVRLRWREEIHPSWIDCPVLYLDATARLSVAERWLGPITPLADVQAAAPHMTLVQVHDRTFGYGAVIAPAGAVSGNLARANQRRIAEVMQVAAGAAGGAGLLVGPKAMITQTQTQGFIPAGWHTANYGALRGVDRFREVPVAVVVSRPLPPPAELERMASIIFACDVQAVDDWYPVRSGARLTADGTGRPAAFECHPDERVEAIRWLICDAEVQQAIGRVRGVRRTGDNPVLVIVLNGVDLGQMAIHQLVSWDDLLAVCGPVSRMAVTGIVPKMWGDIAAVCAPRWEDAADPGHAAKQWFSRHPDEKARLAQMWKTGEVMLPWSERPVRLRRESLGLSGKNHRYVWLAAHIGRDRARAILRCA